MKKNIFVLLVMLFAALTGCQSERPDAEIVPETTEESTSEEGGIVEGVIRVKFTPEMAQGFTRSLGSDDDTMTQEAIDAYVAKIGAKTMKRVFPYAGKYEGRTRRAGLHRWYDIEFDETKTNLRSTLRSLPGVEIVEDIYRARPLPTNMVPFNQTTLDTRALFDKFDDPFLKSQWHYNNTGARPKFIATADINLRKAWEIETGKPKVIVAIVDGGIDVTHPDLVDNLWRNEKEIYGQPGVDDDDNGRVDDMYGYNFVSDQGLLKTHAHGTHVAGTVGARNNNGMGVAGVAGGDGSEGSGVKLMSCQFVEHGPNGKDISGDVAEAIKYGADNGAVISQNSWGFPYPGPTEIPPSLKEAIDYFIREAGCDDDGNQLPDSPMKGGVVIFAAGNDNKDAKAQPQSYEEVICVGSMGAAFKKAYYANYGDWIDMTAPGGDQSYGTEGMILSTGPNGKYVYMEGTSMACPHVSGVAALVVSKYGEQGFTNKDLKRRLLNAMSTEDINEHNPEYVGQLGAGYIDAVKALSDNMEKAPSAVATVTTEEDFNSINLSWKAVEDADDITADAYYLYYSTEGELNANNYTQATKVRIVARKDRAGALVSYTLKAVPEDTQFYMAIVAQDRWGLTSQPTFFKTKTKKNNPPELRWVADAKIVLAGTQTAQGKLYVRELDGQEWDYTLSGTTTGITHYRVKNEIIFKFRANAAPGEHTLQIDVTDIMGAKSTLNVPFVVYENANPQLVENFGKIYVPVTRSEYLLDLSEYISDPNDEKLTYTVRSLDSSIATASAVSSLMTIAPKQLGQVSVEVVATDSHGSSLRAIVEVSVVPEGLVHNVYPIPARDVLNVVLDNDVYSAGFSIYSATGTLVSTQSVLLTDSKNRVAKVDVTKLSSGSYVLEVNANGKSHKTPFTKY